MINGEEIRCKPFFREIAVCVEDWSSGGEKPVNEPIFGFSRALDGIPGGELLEAYNQFGFIFTPHGYSSPMKIEIYIWNA